MARAILAQRAGGLSVRFLMSRDYAIALREVFLNRSITWTVGRGNTDVEALAIIPEALLCSSSIVPVLREQVQTSESVVNEAGSQLS